MIESRPRLPVEPPDVPAPRALPERRIRSRRAEDQVASEETLLLARALDILARDAGAEGRLADLLELLARTVGARHAAIVADGTERRVAVGVGQAEDPATALALGSWLDSAAPRTRADRAASAGGPDLRRRSGSYTAHAPPGARPTLPTRRSRSRRPAR